MTRAEALAALAAFPARLEAWAAALPAEGLRQRPSAEAFAPLEQVWHLAELEVVFGQRLARLRDEAEPHLPDWRGDLAAVEGRYLERDLGDGLRAFRAARQANLAAFAALVGTQWMRRGTQEGVGDVDLDGLPVRMAEHDAGHAAEMGL